MVDRATGHPMTAHTTNQVPVVLVNGDPGVALRADGILSAAAPTILDLLGVPIPADMITPSLLVRKS